MNVDQHKTALINGYTEGQAISLARWTQKDFMIFMEDMIPAGIGKTLIMEDGTMEEYKQPIRTNGPDVLPWKKSRYALNEQFTESANDLKLVAHINKNGGKLTLGKYEYIVSQDGKYLKRRPASLR